MQELKNLIIEKIKNLYNIQLEDIVLDIPPKKELGDFCFGPFSLSKELKKSPAQISNELLEALKGEKLIKDLGVAGPYLNIKVSNNLFKDLFLKAYNEFYAGFNVGNGKTIFIDYIGTNVGKPLHIGHMCTPNQGQAIYNVYKKLGYNVIGDSHIGDWGIIFGKLIFAYKTWGEEEKLKENAVDYLLELYVKVTAEVENNNSIEEKLRQEFKLLSEGNPESISLWQKFTRYSIDNMQVELDRLHVRPDFDIGESFYEGLGLPKMGNYPDLTYNMKDIVKELVGKGIATKNDDGSVGVVFSEETKIPSVMLQKRDGTHGYLASDLAAVKYRMQNFLPEKIVYFVANEQLLHLKQVFTISKMVGWVSENTELFHAHNGFISLKEGKMSSRKGNIIKLRDLLDEAIDRAKKIILEKRQDFSETELKKLSEIIGIGAIKYGYLSKSRTTNVVFDWDEFMTFEGNSGPYIQYAYVRGLKILKKSGFIDKGMEISQKQKVQGREIFEKGAYQNVSEGTINLSDEEIGSFSDVFKGDFESDEETELIKELANYKEILLKTSNEYFPHILAGYSYNLTKKFNAFYNNVRVLEEEDEDKKVLKLMLVKIFLETLKDSFGLLGIEMPEEM